MWKSPISEPEKKTTISSSKEQLTSPGTSRSHNRKTFLQLKLQWVRPFYSHGMLFPALQRPSFHLLSDHCSRRLFHEKFPWLHGSRSQAWSCCWVLSLFRPVRCCSCTCTSSSMCAVFCLSGNTCPTHETPMFWTKLGFALMNACRTILSFSAGSGTSTRAS